MKMHRVARARWCAGNTASGFSARASEADDSALSRPCKASAPKPVPASRSSSRRGTLAGFRSVDIRELVAGHEKLHQVGPNRSGAAGGASAKKVARHHGLLVARGPREEPFIGLRQSDRIVAGLGQQA